MSIQTNFTRRGILQWSATATGLFVLSACGQPEAQTKATGEIRRGGRLIVGVTGGSQSDTLDGHSPIGIPQIARAIQIHEPLTGYTSTMDVEMRLAESCEPNSAGDVWTIRLKDGITFHNGKDVTAADIDFTLKRITDPDNPKSMATSMPTVNLKNSKIVDAKTYELHFDTPFSIVPELLADYKMGIVPEGYDPKNPIGAGPFKFDSYTPGSRSMFTAFENYWREGFPYVDELEIIDFPDEDARINAFTSNQINVIDGVPPTRISTLEASSQVTIIESESANWNPISMRTDVAPFNDERVRQAFRLIVDREALVAQAYGGHARIANDYYSPYDAGVVELPQREQDLDQARHLLKAAGHESLQITLESSDIMQGFMETAQVFAEQARGLVDVKINKRPASTYYGEDYGNYHFSLENKGDRGFLRTAQQSSLAASPYNSPHFNDEEFEAICARAFAETDEAARNELIAEAQRIDYERGGWIIPAFVNLVDATASNLAGIEPNRSYLSFDAFSFYKLGFLD